MYVKVGGRWRYVKPVVGKNNKLRPDYAVIGGVATYVPNAGYYLRFREGSKTIWRKCSSAADATVARERQEAYLNAYAHGLTPSQQAAPVPKMVSDLLNGWLEEYRLSHREETYNLMKHTLYEFFGYWDEKGRRVQGFVSANLIEHVRRYDLLRFKQHLIDKGRSARTAANKCLRINQFIRSVLKLDPGKGVITVKDMKFTEPEVSVYNDDELAAFFKECDAYRHAIFKTFLMAGLRKAELENLTWDDVDFTAGIIRVRPKKDWQPKTWEARDIEVPDDLLTILKEMPHRGKQVFANSGGHKYTHSWDDCAAIAKRSKVEGAHPHKFRATYATRLLQNGVDLKTVQKLLGHRDIESTMRYLARAESKKVREKVNAVKFGA
jgi:integrase/recombinase XerD